VPEKWLAELEWDLATTLEPNKPPTDLTLTAWGRALLPAHFTRQPSAMHDWLGQQLNTLSDRRGTKLNVIGPRGGAKSTLVTLAYVLRAALEGREPYIWIVSDTRHQACAHLDNIKSELVDNADIAARYPGATGIGGFWRAGAIMLKGGAVIDAFGAGQRIRGRRRRENRPTLIVCDDLQNDQHMDSARQRDYARRWFHGTLLKAGTKRTNIVHLATALHRDALGLELHRTAGWLSRIFPAIQRWPDRLELWEAWEQIYADAENADAQPLARAFYDAHQPQMDAGAELLWPDEEDLYTLMCMRAESGRAAFEREKQGSPLNPESCEWPESYFAHELWFTDWPRDAQVRVIALDPSKGQDARRGDYSAFVLLAVDRGGVCYVEADLGRRPTPQLVADGVELCRRFRPHAVGIETNQFQELLGEQFAAELRQAGLYDVQPFLLDNQINKRVRIRRLGPLLAARRLRFLSNSPSTRMLVNQLKDFPAGDFDDGPDALEMAVRLASEMLGGAQEDGLGSRLVASSWWRVVSGE
jgi:predicted phage terminase large subunit-like protein